MTTYPPRIPAATTQRILFVTPRYFPDMGGIETHVYEVARRLAQRAAITVLTTDRSGQHPRDSVADAVRILRVPAYPQNRDYYVAPELRAHIRRADYDIVHVQGYHTFVPPFAMWAAQREGLPYVLTFHSGGSSSGLRNLIRPLQVNLQRPLFAGAARLIGVSKFEAGQFQSWLKLPAERFTVVYNGASLPPVPIDFTPSAGATETILSVGRLEKYKG
ncbi:MAG: glycosyltransferase family 4 protein, partial [Anaerolineae bacterium]|nr:glycosyltransferase family 4 protein [Anaerolineae bacterium]